MINNSKQDWSVGKDVRVGYHVLRVVEIIPTPGDYLPDAYVLSNLGGTRFYRFIPHNGLHRCESLAEAIA